MSSAGLDATAVHRSRVDEAGRIGRRQGWRRVVPDPWHFLLFPLSIVMVIPFLWMLITSFMTHGSPRQAPVSASQR